MNTRKITIILLLTLCYMNSSAQVSSLKTSIKHLIKDKKATVGVSVVANDLQDTINVNADLHYPMQSVFKFPIAMAVLAEIDKGNLSLNQEVKITSKDLLPNTWSPIRDKYPNGTTMTISEIISYTISQSDNNGCDILLRLIGSTTTVEAFLQSNQLPNISVKANEADMRKAWSVQFQNWATPAALANLLVKFYSSSSNGMLSKNSYDFLWKTMAETTTGASRLKGQLPQGTVVAHKTGSSGANNGVTVATNDIGVIILPNGKPIFISVLITNSLEEEENNEKIISDIAKVIWDYYSKF